MSWFKVNTSSGRLLYSVIILTLITVGICTFLSTPAFVNANSGKEIATPAATFPANAGSLGGIADGGSACAPTPGAARDVTFTVSGLSGSVSTVEVNCTFGSPIHTWMGDIVSTLIAPNGASFTLFGRTGATTATSSGDSSDLAGPYTFSDAAPSPPGGGWWQESNLTDAVTPMATGTYRTTQMGGAGVPNPAPATNLNAAFSGVSSPNGTWTLRLTDGCSGDTGAITAANLTLTTGGAAANTQHYIDYDGDGKTDFSVVRNIGSGGAGQARWFNAINGTGATTAIDWGLGLDFYTPCDFDGDHKTDVAVWRPSTPGNSFFYILQSQTSTLRVVNFGQSGDDTSVVGDYDGDGKCDPAVYRPGVNPGDQSTWYYLGSLNNPSGNITYVPWGSNGDFPAPGDYDGDGKNDFVIQRADGGNARFWELLSSGSINNSNLFGLATDIIVPGDFDADGKTDLSIVRGAGNGTFEWWQKLSSNGAIQATQFGSSQDDFVTPGDYDGDGKTDIAVWRPDPAAPGVFWYTKSGSGGAIGTFQFGSFGDYPLANSNTH